MSDLRLITILPSQPLQVVQQSQTSGNSSAQPSLAGIQIGSILSGFIINRDNNGNPILRTDSGDIAFVSNFFLKIGSEITIRIENIAGNHSAHIISVNGQPPELAVLQSGLSQEPEVIISDNLRPTTQSTDTTNAPPSAPKITVVGTIISPPPDQQPTTSNQQSHLPKGSQLSLKIVSLTIPSLPNQQSSNQPQTIISTTTTKPESHAVFPNSYAAYSRSLPDAPTLPVISPPLQSKQIPTAPPQQIAQTVHNYPTTSNETEASAISIHPTLQPTTSAELPPSGKVLQIGQHIAAIVINSDTNGEAILQTPLGIIRLQAETPLPNNSHVIFELDKILTPEILENTNNQQLITNHHLSPAPVTQLARNPGALGNIFSLLANFSSNAALNFINKTIPTILQSAHNQTYTSEPSSHNILASLLTFTIALRSGDFRAWLGHSNVKFLEDNGYDDLLKKAEAEFMLISRQFVDTPEKQWQSLFFPIAVDGELQQARLFVKRDRRQKEKDGKLFNEEDTRFVLEMDLSQLGEMQMDGFVRRDNASIKFDLIIRSHIPLSQNLQQDILEIYNNIGELTGYTGNINFQNMKEFPVNPMEDVISGKHKEIIA